MNTTTTGTERIRAAVTAVIKKQPSFAMGHGFLHITTGSGHRICVSIDGRKNHDKIIAAAKDQVGVRTARIVLD